MSTYTHQKQAACGVVSGKIMVYTDADPPIAARRTTDVRRFPPSKKLLWLRYPTLGTLGAVFFGLGIRAWRITKRIHQKYQKNIQN